MWAVRLACLCLLSTLSTGQEQFHRAVKTPAGPSQVSILRGGFLNNGGTAGVEQAPQEEERYVLDDQPQPALPLQATLDQPIPQDGGPNNPFTNGEDGFGLRLSQAPPPTTTQQQPQPPQLQQIQQHGAPILTHQHHQALISQPFPIFHQTPLILPQLAAGQQYVDNYGRTVVYTPPEPPTTQPPPTTTTPPAPTVAVQKHALVDEYGRQVAQFETHAVVPVAPVIQSGITSVAPVPVPVAQAAVPISQPGAVSVPHAVVPVAPGAAEVALLAKKAPPPVSLHAYAVPAVRKVGNLVIPFAHKVVFAKAPDAEVVFPPSIAAPAFVKGAHRTIVSPTQVVGAAAVPVAHQVHHLAHPAVEVHQSLPVLQEAPVALATDPAPVVAHPPPPVVVEQHVLPEHHHIQFHHPQPVAIAAHPGHPQVLHAPLQLPLAHAAVPAVVPQVAPVVHAPPPVLVKKVKQALVAPAVAKAIIPDVTLIHQPVLSKVLFQRHIFNVKHGNDPIIYQDLCTVYPLQKNIQACLLKKAVLPELHHPDIRTLNVEEPAGQQQTDQTVISGGTAVVPPAPSAPSVVVTKNPPKNIQETIKRESAKSRAAAVAAAAAAASATSSSTTVQPETAESRNTVTAKARRSRRKKGSKGSSKSPSSTTPRPFMFGS